MKKTHFLERRSNRARRFEPIDLVPVSGSTGEVRGEVHTTWNEGAAGRSTLDEERRGISGRAPKT